MAVLKKMQELAKLKLPIPNAAPTIREVSAPPPTATLTVEQLIRELQKAQRSSA